MNPLLFLIIAAVTGSIAQAQPRQELQAVKSLCGCYEVDFRYAETFAPAEDYKFRPRYHATGLEWIYAEETTDKKIVIQHLLLVSDSMVIKHWREDWEYEKADWWLFNHDASWKHVTGSKPSVKGQWTQTVWEVDDAPRYQGSSNWLTVNNKYFWQNTTNAPLPRREYSKRSDYNMLQRTNRIILTDTGWVHEQDNKKVIRKDGHPDVVLAEEKGYNIYRKVADTQCAQAAAWWQQHKTFWNVVRQSWEELLKEKATLNLVWKVEGKLMYEKFDELEKQALTGAALKASVKELLNKYINKSGSAVVVK